MKFIDECILDIKAGKGGDGVVSFRREARVSRGGPDGGDGGNGGSIYFVGDPGINTLIGLKLLFKIHGNDGENGRKKNQHGATGKDKYIKVPIGTLVYDKDRLVCDVVDTKEYLVATGGRGGKGNARFKSSRNQAPRLSENGTNGEHFEAKLTLKVLADVGFVGKPSAGKSTLLSKISNAKPKIADYEFTTLTPQLGLVKTGSNSFVAADLPGLIKGASQGKGLGHDFLKHIERCRVIAHIIDFGSEEKDPIKDYKEINKELLSYNLELEKRDQVVVANKSDMEHFENNLKKFKAKFPKIKLIEISALTNNNLELLKNNLYITLKKSKEITYNTKVKEVTIKLEDDLIVEELYEGMYEVSGVKVKKVYDLIPLNTFENRNRFNQKMKSIGVWKKLEELNIQDGDTVRIYGLEFIWGEGF